MLCLLIPKKSNRYCAAFVCVCVCVCVLVMERRRTYFPLTLEVTLLMPGPLKA